MDSLRGYEDERVESDPAHDGAGDPGLDIGSDERRMHVRAYNHWVSLLRGRAYPAIEDLDPASITDFGPNSVLLDFSAGIENPAVQFLGRALREECGLDGSITHIADVPARSLLSRLTDHYLQIIANRAPIGFEAEFVGTRGRTTLYRGILMPFSSDEDSIDYIYGVINWKEIADPETQAQLAAELEAATRSHDGPAPAWADGPSAAGGDPAAAHAALADQLMMARESAAAARASDTRSRAALYRALGRAHDFALATVAEPDAYDALLAQAGVSVQKRAPMTPVVKLVFGVDYDKTRVTEFATVLAEAAKARVPAGGLGPYLDGFEGGIKGVVAQARAARRPAAPARKPRFPDLANRPALAQLELATHAEPGAPVLLVARADAKGTLAILGALADDAGLIRRAVAALPKG